MHTRPTITDVARAAGVSKGAVSFAFNDRPGLAPETRDRILATARSMTDFRSEPPASTSTSTSTTFVTRTPLGCSPEAPT